MKFSNSTNVLIQALQDMSSHELHEIYELRSKVFVLEQKCIYLDPDYEDKKAWHACYRDENALLGYCRILKKDNWHIGRVAVTEQIRGQHIGKSLLIRAIEFCTSKSSKSAIEMSAQVYLIDYYKSLGFTPKNSIYLEDGIPHIKMSYQSTAD